MTNKTIFHRIKKNLTVKGDHTKDTFKQIYLFETDTKQHGISSYYQ